MVYHKVSVPGGEHHTVHLSVAEVHKALILERIIGSVFLFRLHLPLNYLVTCYFYGFD